MAKKRGRSQLRCGTAAELPRVEARHELAGRVAQAQTQLGGLARSQPVEHARNGARNARPHEDVSHARQHRAEERRHGRKLDLLEVVDPHGGAVPLASEEDLDEVGGDDQILSIARQRPLLGRHGCKGSIHVLATGNEPAIEDPARDAGHGKLLQRPTDVSAGVAELQAPRENDVESRARNDSQLPGLRDGARERPAGNARPHAALDDRRVGRHLNRPMRTRPRRGGSGPGSGAAPRGPR